MSSTRYGPQPGRKILHLNHISIRVAAERLGVPGTHLKNALHGRTRPRPEVVEFLPELLGVPLEDLHTAEALERPFASHTP